MLLYAVHAPQWAGWTTRKRCLFHYPVPLHAGGALVVYVVHSCVAVGPCFCNLSRLISAFCTLLFLDDVEGDLMLLQENEGGKRSSDFLRRGKISRQLFPLVS